MREERVEKERLMEEVRLKGDLKGCRFWKVCFGLMEELRREVDFGGCIGR